MIERPLRRYGALDAPALMRLYRRAEGYSSVARMMEPGECMKMIDSWLAASHIWIMGRDPRHEAFIFMPNHNAWTYQAHFVVREDKRGGDICRLVAAAAQQVFVKTACRTVLAYIEEGNRGARSLLGQLGMKEMTRLPASKMAGQKMVDEILYYGTVDDFNAIWGTTLGEV